MWLVYEPISVGRCHVILISYLLLRHSVLYVGLALTVFVLNLVIRSLCYVDLIM